MNRKALHDHIHASLHGQPQKQALAEAAIKDILSGLDELAKLGHSFQVVPEIGGNIQSEFREYPKMLYHPMFPGGMSVENEEVERAHLQQGWKLTQEDANDDASEEVSAMKETSDPENHHEQNDPSV